ncbi:MAG: LamG domain-containing protein [Lentisphaeria bacterium]|nr:LamG domain-containing protein [Lentisphaeria bacterium]
MKTNGTLLGKRFWVLPALFCALTGFCAASPVFETTFLQDGQGNVLDNVNKEYKGKLHKGASIVDAPFGKVLKLDKVLDNGAFFGKNPALAMEKDYTISRWLRVASWPEKKAKRGFGSLVAFQWGSLRLAAEKGGIAMQTHAGEKRNILFKAETKGGIFDKGEWVHVALVWKVGEGIILYIDGEKKAERKTSISTKAAPEKIAPPACPVTEGFLIGSLRNFFPFHGEIARVRLYNTALTPEELTQTEKDYVKILLLEMKKELSPVKGSEALVRRIEKEAENPTLPALLFITAEKNRLVSFEDVKKKVKSAGDGSLAYAVVDPMGPVVYYRNTEFPQEGLNGKLLIAAAQNEYEPASFLVNPLRDIKGFLPVVEELKDRSGHVISPEALDIRLVKQIIGKDRLLSPDVLLHDDKMLKVDVENRQMSIRCSFPEGEKYIDVTPEKLVKSVRATADKYPVHDSRTLQKLDLAAGVKVQFWVTLRTHEKMAPGLYEGRIALTGEGKTLARIPVKIRIFPFTLPEPAVNYDLSREFSVAVYFFDHEMSGTKEVKVGSLNHTRPLTEQQLKAYLINLREHGVRHPTIIMGNYFPGWNPWKTKGRQFAPRTTNGDKTRMEWMKERIRILRECGFTLNPLYLHTGGNVGFREFYKRAEHKKYLESFIREGNAFYKEILGHSNIYHYGLDEAEGERLLAEYEVWEDMRALGAKIYTTIKKANTPLVAGRIDVAIAVHQPEKATSKLMHDKGGRLWVYAQPWAGQPAAFPQRKGYGYGVYFAEYEGVCSYSYNHWSWENLPWNMHVGRKLTYVMPTADGVLDTPGWEGHREGTDDVRYATKLRQEIVRAKAGSDEKKKARALEAERFLDTVDIDSLEFDPAWVRYHVIDFILDLI